MKSRVVQSNWLFFLLIEMLLFLGLNAVAQQINYLQPQPLTNAIRVSASPYRDTGTIVVPLITWGGDVATIFAKEGSIFQQNGLNVELSREDKFKAQVEAFISGHMPYLRGTMGMINLALEVCKQKGIEVEVIFQMTWSTGGDAIVVRGDRVKRPADLRGKIVALQLYGPHMDYIANVLQSANVPISSVTFKYLEELTLPTYETPQIIDPVNAFTMDESIDAVMCIIPDALMLTSRGNVGTGAEGSVKGAKILLSTKTASRIIADVYVVRKDYRTANPQKVDAFVESLLKGQEGLAQLQKNKGARQGEWQQLLAKSAEVLLGTPTATQDVEAMLADCTYVGRDGNAKFFSGKGTTRSLNTLTKEIQRSYKPMGFMSTSVPLSAGGKFAIVPSKSKTSTALSKPKPKPKPKYDTKKVAAKAAAQIEAEPTVWEEKGTLFIVEINFAPNQSKFSISEYEGDFEVALGKFDTYGGAVVYVEGHSDPLGVLRAKKQGNKRAEVNQMVQVAKNLSQKRAEAVKKAFIDYCVSRDVWVDDSQFIPLGLGITTPKYNPPRTEEEWKANRRVVFRIKQIEAELTEFVELD